MRVVIPQTNKWAGRLGVAKVLEALAPVPLGERRIRMDFEGCHFMSAEATAILAGTKLIRDQEGLATEIDLDTLDQKVRRVLEKSKFLSLFGQECFLPCGNSLPICALTKFSIESIIQYVDGQIMHRHEMPKMTPDLAKEIRKAFFELFGNVFHHSSSAIGGIVCGQVYPVSKEIQIVLYDMGMGIARRVRSSVSTIKTDHEAISWALQRGTSTLANHCEPRGLGLYLLREFLRVNEGAFIIYANKAAIEEVKGRRAFSTLRHDLRGTLIDMRIKVRDDVKYALSRERETS
jgi:anti-sigma regulatory factor (Ser/Thr protein kinase)